MTASEDSLQAVPDGNAEVRNGSGSVLRLHRIVPKSKAEGPGLRYVIWVQGCSIRCPGCAVPGTWDFEGGFSRDVVSLAGEIRETSQIEGLTVLGGEPFDQAAPLAELIGLLDGSNLSVMVFTGYELEFLGKAKREDWDALLSKIDLLIDGPFIESLASFQRPWIGSSNQGIHFLTDRYADRKEHLAAMPNRIEVKIAADGSISMNGMAPTTVWNGLVRWLEQSGDCSMKGAE